MNIPLFDSHCDALYKLMATPDQHLTDSDGQWSLDRCQRFAPQAQVFAIFADSAQPDVREQAARQIQRMHQECALAPDRITLCTTGTQAKEAVAAGKLAAFLSVEGAELLDCSLEKLRWAHGQGVRIVHPTWNHANVLSGSHCDQPERGLSQQGRRFVSEMVSLGMLVDVSHLSEAGFWDVVELVQGPFLASHSNSQSAFFHTRNLTDRQFTAIMKYRGVVGLNAYARFLGDGPVTTADLRRHLEHFLALGGTENVALGGDWDGCDQLPEGFTGIWNWADFYEELLRCNYPESLVRDLFWNNLMRTVKTVCIM